LALVEVPTASATASYGEQLGLALLLAYLRAGQSDEMESLVKRLPTRLNPTKSFAMAIARGQNGQAAEAKSAAADGVRALQVHDPPPPHRDRTWHLPWERRLEWKLLQAEAQAAHSEPN
jgi:hypothetical protein